MHRLSALDAAFLYLETPDTPMHIGSLTVFRASENADGLFERFVAHTRARLSLLPSYTRRLKPTPLDLDHPVWTPAEPELDWHLRHCALPSPGTMEQLRAEVARQHAIPLERSRPLWQYCLIEGLQDGGFAVYAKVHHAAMDGVAGLGTLGVVYDFVPDAPPPRPRPKMDDEQEPDALELDEFAGDYDNRYYTVSLVKARGEVPLFEVRMHHGTHNFNKIALWLSVWTQVLNAARYRRAGPARPGLVFPGRNRRIALGNVYQEDIVALLTAEGVPLTPEFVGLLRGRRKELRASWERVVPNRVGQWAAAGWAAWCSATARSAAATASPPACWGPPPAAWPSRCWATTRRWAATA